MVDKKLLIFGTRPEFIKLIPVIHEIDKQGIREDFIYVFTGQHSDLISDLFLTFNFTPDITLPFQNHNNSLGFSFVSILSSLQTTLHEIQKEFTLKMLIAQGDTTSCACAAMCAFLNEIPFAHIEAGLRSSNLAAPFPEEYYRRIASLSSNLHFAPTQLAVDNLLREGIKKEQIILTGNTIVDAVKMIQGKIISGEGVSTLLKFKEEKNIVLISCHRRENQNGKFHHLVETIKVLAHQNPNLKFLWLGHLTPFIHSELSAHSFTGFPNIFISPPLGIVEMHQLYNQTKLIVSDSGGIQEEASSYGIRVIVIRENTERLESIDMNYSVLAEDFGENLILHFNKFLNSEQLEMKNPYGDGKAAQRIVDYLRNLA